MQRHRFLDLVGTPTPCNTAFVPVPVAAPYQAQVAEIYRLAAARTREQLARRRHVARLQPSLN